MMKAFNLHLHFKEQHFLKLEKEGLQLKASSPLNLKSLVIT